MFPKVILTQKKLLRFAVKVSAAPTFSILKRPEEKKLVEQMHQNARFVEDVVRKCVQFLREKYPKRYCVVKCVSLRIYS